MRRFMAKFGYVHRQLWRRDATYRVAVLLGPPPLLAGLIALAVWAGVQSAASAHRAPASPPAWAAVTRTPVASSTDPPRVAQPMMEVPALGPNRLPTGFVTGWRGGIQSVEVNEKMEVKVTPAFIARITLDTVDLPLERVNAAAPANGRFVGSVTAGLVVRSPGVYAIALRLERDDANTANCLQRIILSGHHLISSHVINQTGPTKTTSPAFSFFLTPGLYPVTVGFGCWRDQKNIGAGRATVLIRDPGESELRPTRPDEILRPVSEGARN